MTNRINADVAELATANKQPQQKVADGTPGEKNFAGSNNSPVRRFRENVVWLFVKMLGVIFLCEAAITAFLNILPLKGAYEIF
ncbi:unnamed protein product, partial [marine sediment metagenome]